MAVIGVNDVMAALDGVLRVAPRDIITPLARERAADMGVTIVVGPAEPDRPQRPKTANISAAVPQDPGPQSGALFRRGGPVRADVAAPQVRVLGSRPLSTRPGRVSRVVVVGAGHVGMITALRLAEADVIDEVVLTDLVEGLAAGIALDIAHTSSLSGFSTRMCGVGSVEEAGVADYYVVTAGRPRSPGMSRTDLVGTNAAIVDEVCRAIARTSPNAVVVVVTNPLDEMTYQAWRSTGFPAERVVGMAGLLDTARFRSLAAIACDAAPETVDAIAMGSHGEEMVIPLSRASVSGAELETRLGGAVVGGLVERARGSGAEIVGLLGKGSAFMAPGTSAARMVLAMVRDDGEVIPSAVLAQGAYGIHDVFIGLPASLGRGGVREVLEVPLTPQEREQLVAAADRVRQRVAELDAG